MRFRTEDGLDFWCMPIEVYRFNLTPDSLGIYTITIDLDGDTYVVGTTEDAKQYKRKARNFVGKYKLPVKILFTEYISDKEYRHKQIGEYTYEFYQKYATRKYGSSDDSNKPKKVVLKKEPFV